MNHADLYFSANEQLRLIDLIPVTQEVYEQEDKTYWDNEFQSLTYQEWKQIISQHWYDVNKLMKNKNEKSIRRFFYVGEYSAVEIHSIDPSWLLNPFTIQCLKRDEAFKKEFLSKNYLIYFFPEFNLFAIDFFIRLYKEIDTELIWEAFKSLYIYANYGFHMFPEEVLQYVFQYANSQEAIDKLKKLKKMDEDDTITIYRGEGKRSTPIQKALSWTLSREIAERFAHFYGEGNVYRGKVKIKNIIDYITEREEEEILVRYQDIEDIQLIRKLNY